MNAPAAPGLAPADLDRMLRACIQCGLCLPVCATYRATGNEAHSPRGRLLLLAAQLAAPAPRPAAAVLEAYDLCLGCLACVTACPSGIAAELLDAVKAQGHRRRSRLTGLLARALASPRVLAVLGAGAPLGRGVVRALGGAAGRPGRRLALRLGAVPRAPRRDRDLIRLLDRLAARAEARAGRAWPGRRRLEAVAPGPGTAGPLPGGCAAKATGPASSAGPATPANPAPTLLAFTGCANGGLLPGTSRRLRELLTACGHAVAVPAGQGCCGALAAHAGQERLAARQRRRNARAYGRDRDSGAPHGPPLVIVEAAGCGRELGRHGGELAGRVRDAVAFLAEAALPPARPLPLRVAVHDPCHARHGQGIVEAPRRLLDAVPGLARVEPEEAEVCCGAGGPYAAFHPESAAVMARRKALRLAETGADLVVTSNPGCLGQIAAALAEVAPDLPIVPLTDLLWYACAPTSEASGGG